MKLVYHGTSVSSAIEIAIDGAILSPWDQQIKDYKRIECLKSMSTPELEEIALEDAKSLFGDHEVEHRVKSISLVTAKYFSIAEDYARHSEQSAGGVVLGFEVDRSLLKVFPKDWEWRGSVYVPRKMRIKSLREIHISPKARLHESKIMEAYARYHPRIFYI